MSLCECPTRTVDVGKWARSHLPAVVAAEARHDRRGKGADGTILPRGVLLLRTGIHGSGFRISGISENNEYLAMRLSLWHRLPSLVRCEMMRRPKT